MKWIFTYLRPLYSRIAAGISVKIVGTLAELMIPYLLSHILENVIETNDIAKIVYYGSLMALCALVACLGNIIANRMAAKTTMHFSNRMRRDLFAKTQEAKMRGYDKGRFSFNVKGGRCEACQGDGVKRISMHFLPDVYVPCEECGGKRYNEETLQVTFKDKNIYDVLEMTVEESLSFFENLPRIYNKLKALYDVGLGYIKLGQSATTLSGGEAQRVKLASELQKRATGKTLYILDEPTTGLHSDDVARLIEVLNKIVDNGDTVLIIEHNLDVIKVADHIIDLGLEGGDAGGTIVVSGTPEKVAKCEESRTGQFLKDLL